MLSPLSPRGYLKPLLGARPAMLYKARRRTTQYRRKEELLCANRNGRTLVCRLVTLRPRDSTKHLRHVRLFYIRAAGGWCKEPINTSVQHSLIASDWLRLSDLANCWVSRPDSSPVAPQQDLGLSINHAVIVPDFNNEALQEFVLTRPI